MPSLSRHFSRRWRPRPSSPLPAWAQIEEELCARIQSGDLKVGARLPPERDLAELLGVSRGTVRQALQALAARGLVKRGVGRGTFVASAKIERDLNHVAGFTEQMERAGLDPGARVLSAVVDAAPASVAAALQIPAGAPAARVERVRYAAGVPMTLESSWVPDQLFPGLVGLDLRQSLYALMADLYERAPARAVERFEPVLARLFEARALEVPVGSALMLVERTAYDADDVPLEHSRDLHRGDRARFVVEVDAPIRAHA
jgi:GntR family transcriptional regulator